MNLLDRVSGEDTIAILRQFIEVDDGVIGPFFGYLYFFFTRTAFS